MKHLIIIDEVGIYTLITINVQSLDNFVTKNESIFNF